MVNFVQAAKKSDLGEGKGMVVNLGDNAIALFNVGGNFHAIENTCLHAGGPLHEGVLEGTTVTCPWHEWQYDVTDGSCGLHGGGLTCYPTRVVDGVVEIDVSGLAENR